MTAPVSTRAQGMRPLGLLFAATAVLSYAVSQVLTRHGVSDDASPLLGSFIALSVGTVGFGLLAGRQFSERGTDFRRGAWLFAVAGFFSTLGVVFQFEALHRGQVTVVSPISNTNPLFTLIFATVLLRGVERLTPRVFLGAGMVVAGVVVIRLGRGWGGNVPRHVEPSPPRLKSGDAAFGSQHSLSLPSVLLFRLRCLLGSPCGQIFMKRRSCNVLQSLG